MTWGQFKHLIESRGIVDTDDLAYCVCMYDYPNSAPTVDIRRWNNRAWPKAGDDNWYAGIDIAIPTTSPYVPNPEPMTDEAP